MKNGERNEDVWWNVCIVTDLQLRSLYVGYCTVCHLTVICCVSFCLCYVLIIRFVFVFLFCMFFFLFLCVLCFCIVSPHVYSCPFSVYKFTDHCHLVGTTAVHKYRIVSHISYIES